MHSDDQFSDEELHMDAKNFEEVLKTHRNRKKRRENEGGDEATEVKEEVATEE